MNKDEQRSPMLAKIRALLAKAEATEYPEEAEALTAKAAEWMATYGIEQAMLNEADPSSDNAEDRLIPVSGKYMTERRILLCTIAEQFGCKAYYGSKDAKRYGEYRVRVFGFRSDLERVEMMFTSLVLQAFSGMAKAYVPYGENVAAYRRSWLRGFTIAIRDRIKQAETNAADAAEEERGSEGRSVALVLADRRGVVEALVKKTYTKIGTARPSLLTGGGQRAGYKAGERADLGGTRISSATKRPAVSA
ncbi:DUF2786 domain-containing protein [Streptomyces sp. GMY02]|uniref:DUF2786 domain-containing protein n=1 Tax=Streptomyces sp. GMY02 TaxID=1333528 RepID=UPI001C2BC038|nr:DUF2786 domain-containing protein [Streptomyces sp. GMY02]QXE37139.1 DUF2786 domain-containing protein [Streptomyces sp. GMY02]